MIGRKRDISLEISQLTVPDGLRTNSNIIILALMATRRGPWQGLASVAECILKS